MRGKHERIRAWAAEVGVELNGFPRAMRPVRLTGRGDCCQSKCWGFPAICSPCYIINIRKNGALTYRMVFRKQSVNALRLI